jgi:hypothetical protein
MTEPTDLEYLDDDYYDDQNLPPVTPDSEDLEPGGATSAWEHHYG